MAAQAIIKSLPAEFTLSNTDNINKRPRLEGGQNSDDLETSVYYEDQQYAGHQPNIETIKTNSGSNKNKSIVSDETLESLKILSQGFSSTNYNKIKETTTEALTGLAEYESDADSDDHESEEEHG
jgi:hypothetical protein